MNPTEATTGTTVQAIGTHVNVNGPNHGVKEALTHLSTNGKEIMTALRDMSTTSQYQYFSS